jgi:ABC-type branched-subunit amino acid transport system substrate-binding protein
MNRRDHVTTPSRRRILACLAAVAVAAAACGSSSSSGGGGGGGTTPAATPGVTATSITIGTTTPLTGPAAPGYSEIAPAVNAVFNWVNAQGGIDGRKITYLIKNDEYDPTLTATLTRQLVLQDNIFADVGPLGTPTGLAVEPYLNTAGIPQIFIESGCTCWNNVAQYPWSYGWQPNYVVEGKILGQYIEQHFPGKKIAFLSQDDEFGQDGVKGLLDEIPASQVVSQQTYVATSAGLADALAPQISAIHHSGAQVVVLYTIPAATALALLSSAGTGFAPQFVVSSVGADPPTLTGLLSSFSKGKAGAALLTGIITNAYLPPLTDTSNPWEQLAMKVLTAYDSGFHWDGNSEYGAMLGFSFVELLRQVGPNLTRASLVHTLDTDFDSLPSAGLSPYTFSSTDHNGFSGSEVVQLGANGTTINPLTGVEVTTETGPITDYTGAAETPPSWLSASS